MLDWFDKSSGNKLFYFFFDLRLDIWMEASFALLNRFRPRFDVEGMANHFGIQSWHFLIIPGKNILVFF